jgi:hypothetical protein
MANELKKECGLGMYWCNTDNKCKPIQEDAPINAVGGGQIAGVGVGPQGEPGVTKKKKPMLFSSFLRRKLPGVK